MFRGGPEEASSECFVTCSPTGREGRNRPIGGCMWRPRRGLQWVFRGLFPHWAGGAEQANWWLYAEAPKRPPVVVRGGLFGASNGCFVTCSPTEREGRSRPIGGCMWRPRRGPQLVFAEVPKSLQWVLHDLFPH